MSASVLKARLSEASRRRPAILSQFPSVSIGISRARDTSSVDTSGFTIGLTLPLFSGSRGAIAVERTTREQRGDALFEMQAAPDAYNQYVQARDAMDYAARELKRQEQLLKEHLTTRSQVDTARKTLADARSNLRTMQAQRADKAAQTLKAPLDGIVTSLAISRGDRVKVDTAAMAIGGSDRLIAILGVETEDLPGLRVGTSVKLHSVILVFLLLVFLYESFRVGIAMLATTLLAFPAVFIGLYLTGTEINISSMMGMTMIVGIVTEVGIFFFSEYRTLPGDHDKNGVLILAGKNRMRPIAMTTAAAILALLPLAMGIGQGSAMQRPLAIAIISGLVVQLPLVLIVLPAFLKILKTKNPVEDFVAGPGGEKRPSPGN